MRYDWLLEPVSEAEPCGPDLDDIGDEKYLNYVLSVTSRIPERYYRADTDKAIDRAEIKLKDEVETIGSLLKETRDVRLLCIEARFQSFAGELSGFADCVEAIAGLVERFWEDVHPKAIDGDFTLRQNMLGGLDDWWQVIQPLQHAALVRDKRLGPVLFRHFAIASGSAEKRGNEAVPDIGDIHRALAAEENRALCDISFDAAKRAAAALTRIREAFIENSGYDYVPSFDRLQAFLEPLLKLFQAARPELVVAAAPVEEAPATGDGDGSQAADVSAEAKAPSVQGVIASQADAAAALLAIETYFAAHEPSAPALLLIHQARTLVGKPLIHAIEVLLPEAAPRAMIKIQGDFNLQLNMAQLKQLTADVANPANGANGSDASSNTFSAGSRGEAMTLMAEVEHFFKTAEPSSPVPMLLAKASGFANRDFNAILKDLIGPPA
ncbi:type VI secretion system ImpA family N-terminal domain-containing protein [Mesorhizobium sp. BAC0120]|uniref:type VI secretion system protein TssA n=1 Tax=Mesorhizobium sp. BAC0120 TaxID=3090670 RepID=UPI00298D1890|nr:type VI secretion system ImpA family N-terminal domain-containing protein [Mesorhizobium sp. BAC0120]MDW6025445.1 type VI secretion system ImpA family N-terminal domain-containing protein [Mesorhizobium sp. BAC0120]